MSDFERLDDFFWGMSQWERRKFFRIPVETVVGIDTTRAVAAGVDVSAGGICFSCVGLNVEVGDTLRVDFTLEDQNFSVLGTAVRISEPGLGAGGCAGVQWHRPGYPTPGRTA